MGGVVGDTSFVLWLVIFSTSAIAACGASLRAFGPVCSYFCKFSWDWISGSQIFGGGALHSSQSPFLLFVCTKRWVLVLGDSRWRHLRLFERIVVSQTQTFFAHGHCMEQHASCASQLHVHPILALNIVCLPSHSLAVSRR